MKQITTLLFIGLLALTLQAQKIDIQSKIPIDPSIRTGVFANGLKYYIKYNKQPEKRIELRLAVNAGSMQENESQQGLAHFTEHMCFNGTKHFEKQELVNFLEKMGIEFGAELNAYTSFDETVYKLSVPSDLPGLVDTAFLVLEDWASNVSFDNIEIDKERGVVLSEWRLGLGAYDRMNKQSWPIMLKDSRYAVRLPIGKPEIIEKAPYDTIKQFYKDWYRPNLMAITVAGDFNVDSIESMIKKHFEKLKNPTVCRPRKVYDIPNNTEPLISITKDKEFGYSFIELSYKVPFKAMKTISDFKEDILQSLYNNMINSRFQEFIQNPATPFTYGYSYYGDFLGRTTDAFSSMAIAKENLIAESLAKLIEINNQVKEFGFTANELERQKKEILSSFENQIKEIDKTESKSYAEEYVRNFLKQEPIPGIKNQFEYIKTFFPLIKLDDINALAKKWISEKNIIINIMLPDNPKIVVPTTNDILSVYTKSNLHKAEKYIDTYVEKPMVDKTPVAVKIKSRKEIKEFGFTEIEFDNGAKVILKPNEYKNDEILFLSVSSGGQSLCSEDEIMTSRITSNIMYSSGVGSFDDISLKKKLSGNTAGLHAWISLYNEGTSGQTSPKDLETLLQLNYLYFTAPRVDSDAFETYIISQINYLKFQNSDPSSVLYDTIYKTLYKNNKRYILLNDTNFFKSLKQNEVLAYFKNRFNNASDFTFLMVGNFKVDSVLPLLQTWIGTLPANGLKENFKDVLPAMPTGRNRIVIHKGLEQKATVFIQSASAFVWDRKELISVEMMIEILNIRLRENMREEQSRVYGVSASSQEMNIPRSLCKVAITFGCAPEVVDTLILTVYGEMKKLIDAPASTINLEKVREQLIRNLETDIKTNAYWQSALESKYTGSFDLETYDTKLIRIKSITLADIQHAARTYLQFKDVIEAILLPEGKK